VAIGTEILIVARRAVNIQRTDAAQPFVFSGKIAHEMTRGYEIGERHMAGLTRVCRLAGIVAGVTGLHDRHILRPGALCLIKTLVTRFTRRVFHLEVLFV
jgi:hypothetical protein